MTKYRRYTIERAWGPILGKWYTYAHEDYAGPEDHRSGAATSIEMSKECIDMLEDE